MKKMNGKNQSDQRPTSLCECSKMNTTIKYNVFSVSHERRRNFHRNKKYHNNACLPQLSTTASNQRANQPLQHPHHPERFDTHQHHPHHHQSTNILRFFSRKTWLVSRRKQNWQNTILTHSTSRAFSKKASCLVTLKNNILTKHTQHKNAPHRYLSKRKKKLGFYLITL